jgi:hypothetical protein
VLGKGCPVGVDRHECLLHCAMPILLAGGFTFLLCFACIFAYRRVYPHPTDDTADYVVDYSSILGGDWRASPVQESKYCGAGWCSGASDSSYRHRRNPLAFISQGVSIYSRESLARTAFNSEVKSLSTHYFIKSEDVDLQFDESDFGADKYFIRCVRFYEGDVVKDTQCSALFLHNNYLVDINMWPRRDFEDYISWDQIEAMLHLSDNRIVEARRLG